MCAACPIMRNVTEELRWLAYFKKPDGRKTRTGTIKC